MNPTDLLEAYLIDQEDGLKKLLTWFLNFVMQLETVQQAGARPYQRIESRKAPILSSKMPSFKNYL
jgi:hypothetical protein